MACYLCAQQQAALPKTVAPLPPAAPAGHRAVGTCFRCFVWACWAHGRRIGKFQCAMCLPAVVTKQALAGEARVPDEETEAATAVARVVGVGATDEQRARGRRALKRLMDDLRRTHEPREQFTAEEERPNLIADLAGAIREQTGDIVPGIRESFAPEGPPAGAAAGIVLDAVGGAVRDEVASLRPGEVTENTVVLLTGAVILAMSVADRPSSPEGRVSPEEIEVRPPWEVSHPALLDPLMWAVTSAYHL